MSPNFGCDPRALGIALVAFEALLRKGNLHSRIRSLSLGEINLGFRLDDEEDFCAGSGAIAESCPSFDHVVGGDGEYDIARVRADKMKIAITADETSWGSVGHVQIFGRS
jgi:hypothetical protein